MTDTPKFPPKIMGQFVSDENNGKWQGPYVFCPEQWGVAYDKPNDSWTPYAGETREVLFISEEEHAAILATAYARIAKLEAALDQIRMLANPGRSSEDWQIFKLASDALKGDK